MYQQHNFAEIKETYFEIYSLYKYHVHWLSSFKTLKLPISIKIPGTIWKIVYIYMTALYVIIFSIYLGTTFVEHSQLTVMCQSSVLVTVGR